MTNTYTKEFFSSSSNGQLISISASALPGDLIHTSVSGSTNKDEVYLYGVSGSSLSVVLSVQFGGSGISNKISVPIDSSTGFNLIVPGFPLNNSLEVRAYSNTLSGCAASGEINIGGFVNRITQG